MSCWAILGINPTKNIDVIKDAYTELSNSTNANELIKLKSAYNKALSLAKTSINDLNLSLLGSSNFDILSALINSSIDSKSIDTIDKFIDEANEIYNNPVLRFNIDSWINLLTSSILINVYIFPKLDNISSTWSVVTASTPQPKELS